MKKLPLISCLCVTRNTIPLLTRAVNCFKAQTYKNKELILVYEDNATHIKQFAEGLNDERIKVIEIPAIPKRPLGELRNISISASNGDYFCQWDADDWYHNQRLEIQMKYISLLHKPVCMLTYWIIYDATTGRSFWSYKRIWEGSILCKKTLLIDTVSYPCMEKKEDYYFVAELVKRKLIFPVDNPNLYIYVYHGDNTWNYEHFKSNFNGGKELSGGASMIIKNIMDGKYSNKKASKLLNSPAVLEEMDYKYEH
jgi:glycosyltransferase involved in cell wall biosynthesis